MKRQIKFTEITEGHLVAESKDWTCEIDKTVPLALHIEILNMDDAEYPYVVSIGIVAAKPHKSFNESDNKRPDRYSLIYYMVSYMGSVPVDHKLLRTDALNRNITGDLKARDAKLVTQTQTHGTLAAQEGSGASITYPQFKEYDAAEAWARALVTEYGDVIMGLVGFTLDQPINMIGDTGWSQIETMLQGTKGGSRE